MILDAIIPEDAAAPWRRGWFYAGPAAAVAEDGCHLTIDLPRLSVTVQNFAGTLAGFLNVCTHRATKMRQCGRGRGVLRCPYHGWTYNREGVPVGIPDNEALFQLTPEEKRGLALARVAVARQGPLLFLRLAAEGPDLDAPVFLPTDLWIIAEGSTVMDRPWAEIAAEWAGPEAVAVPPGLAISRAGDWILLRHVLPLAADRSRITHTALHPTLADAGTMPALWREGWPTEVAGADHALG